MTVLNLSRTLFICFSLTSSASAQGLASGDHFPDRIVQLGETLVSTGEDRTLRWWDLKDGSEIRRLDVQPVVDLSVSNILILNGENIIATAHEDGNIVTRAANGKQLLTLKHDGVQSIHFFNDGSDQGERVLRLASGGKDKTLRIWDVARGVQIESFEFSEPILNLVASDYKEYEGVDPLYPVFASVHTHQRTKRALQFIELKTQRKSTPFVVPDSHTRKRTLQFVNTFEFMYLDFKASIVTELVRPKDFIFEMNRDEWITDSIKNPFFQSIWCLDSSAKPEELVAVGGPFFVAILVDGKVSNMLRVGGYVNDIRILKRSLNEPVRIAITYENNIDIWTPADFSSKKTKVGNDKIIHIVPKHR